MDGDSDTVRVPMPDIFDLFNWWVIALVIAIFIFRAWLKGTQFNDPFATAKDQIAVVTGCAGGIGKQIVRELNYRGAKVHMLVHDRHYGEEAMKILVEHGCNVERLVLHHVDLSSFESIREFAKFFATLEHKLDILVNNAGIMLYPKFKLTEDGHELTWQVNYLGHFLLTELMLPFLEKGPKGGRVVNMSALAHYYADTIDPVKMDSREYFDPRQAYAKSKLAMVMHARGLTHRLRSVTDGTSKTTINACHPGICNTRIWRFTPIGSFAVLRYPLAPLMWFFLKNPKDGAQTPLYLCLSKKVDGMSAKYFAELMEKKPSDLCNDDKECEHLYNASLEAVGLAG